MAQLSEDRLALLYRVSQTLNSSLDLNEVLSRVMDEVIAATRAERGFLMLHESGGELTFKAARGMDQRAVEAPEFQVSRGIVERVAHEGQPLLTSDAQTDEWLRGRASVMALGLRAILCVPLQHRDRLIGVVYVDNRIQAGVFSRADLDLLAAIASSAAVAIENARLYQLAVEQGRLERELQLAREVQMSLLPRETPQLPGWEFAAFWQPARTVAGDFYDFVPLNDGALGLVIADVSDKGMAAALFMALSRSVLRASLADRAPSDGIAYANRLITADSANSMFVTLFYIQLNAASGGVEYVNAGHNAPLLYCAASGDLAPLPRTGMPLGLDEAAPFGQRRLTLQPGDCLLLYTDGVTDALDPAEQEFGLDRLQAILREHGHRPAPALKAALKQALSEFIGAGEPFDDITVVVAKRVE
jgi:sigma-B regulation protein RsbU (phosphoserine phosphatase)